MLRRPRSSLAALAAALSLAACGAEPAKAPAAPPAAQTPSAPAQAPPSAAKPSPAVPAPEAPATTALDDKWASHKGSLDFVLGMKAGMAQAKSSGRPMFVYYTQHG